MPKSTIALAGLSLALMCISPPNQPPDQKIVIQQQVLGYQQCISNAFTLIGSAFRASQAGLELGMDL